MIEQQPTTIDLQPPTTTVVSLTDAAVSKLLELTKEETNPDVGLRVYVYSGGCSGFRYGMMLEDAPTPEDQILEASGIKVYVDGQSISLLQGSQIDYVDTLMGAGFTVNNPNAVAACGCGSSFRTADDEGARRAARTDRSKAAADRLTAVRADLKPPARPAASSCPGRVGPRGRLGRSAAHDRTIGIAHLRRRPG